MSRQPSPGPSASDHPTSYYRDAHGLPIERAPSVIKIVYRGSGQHAAPAQAQQDAPATAATSSATVRTKGRAYQSGIAAGAEDVKYAAKYRDLKQKVKEIEADNDRLTFKVLQAKRSIQRAKLERAILYERLGALPASPPPGNAALPPQHVAQQVLPGGQVSRHPDAQPYGQSGRRQRISGPPAPHHHHPQHHQQPIQPAPPSQVSPPQHHLQAHHPHHPVRDAAHPGQLPITHAPQVCSIETAEGPLLVVAGPDGRPVTTADGHVIPAQDIHAPPPPSAPQQRKRGGRVSKEVREMREREAREMREREEMDRKREQALLAGASSGHAPHLEPPRSSSSSRSHSAHMQGVSPQLPPQAPGAPQIAPMSSRERDREWEIEREMRDRERMQRREGREDERERSSVAHGHGHQAHHHSGHAHGHRYHPQQVPEHAGSPPPPGVGSGPSPVQASPPHAHRSHSQVSHYSAQSYSSHHGHGHHVHSHHSHSHSASPRSPGGTVYPATRIHAHQRVGPGSYVMRELERADAPPTEHAPAAPTPVSATAQQNDDAPAPPPAASSSRVPTPPYMQRPVRTELFNSNASPTGEDAAPSSGAKSEAHPSEDGSGARSASTTPS